MPLPREFQHLALDRCTPTSDLRNLYTPKRPPQVPYEKYIQQWGGRGKGIAQALNSFTALDRSTAYICRFYSLFSARCSTRQYSQGCTCGSRNSRNTFNISICSVFPNANNNRRFRRHRTETCMKNTKTYAHHASFVSCRQSVEPRQEQVACKTLAMS